MLDSTTRQQGDVAQLKAELRNAEAEWHRYETPVRGKGIVSHLRARCVGDQGRGAAGAAGRAPRPSSSSGRRALADRPGASSRCMRVQGERVGPDGIAELGQTDAMYAIAEVYETDVARVRVGQRATVTQPGAAAAVQGTVERIGLKIGKKDVLSVDPAAKTDARVVEVRDPARRSAAPSPASPTSKSTWRSRP